MILTGPLVTELNAPWGWVAASVGVFARTVGLGPETGFLLQPGHLPRQSRPMSPRRHELAVTPHRIERPARLGNLKARL